MSLSTMGRTYTIDFNAMQQINEDSGTTRPVQRKANPLASPAAGNISIVVFICYTHALCNQSLFVTHAPCNQSLFTTFMLPAINHC